MKKNSIFIVLCIALTVAMIAGCTQPPVVNNNQQLSNSTLDSQLENLTIPGHDLPVEFNIEFEKNPNASYDFASDDVFTVMGSDFNSSKVAVFGILLGDSYEKVLAELGTPDLAYVPADKSYRNLEYSKKVGIDNKVTAITFHFEGDKVTRISMRQPFNKYLSGNTTLGQTKEYVYSVFDTPDYQSFTEYEKVFHYVENGLELYLNKDRVEIISIIPSKTFKGVVYKTVSVQVSDGIWVNVTKPVEIE